MTKFTCYHVTEDDDNNVRSEVTQRPLAELPAGDVLVRVRYSSVNYKDALAARGNPGVARQLPHVPGIDAAGIVEESDSADFAVGQQVLITGYELGSGHWGGWARYVRVPSGWIVPLPEGLTLRDSMILGTAGFTAALCVDALVRQEVVPDAGDIVVTGATGGVGSLAVRLLSHLGYRVLAVTGKPEAHERLRAWGSAEVLSRQDVVSEDAKPLLPGRFAGAVDTVGGETLATIVRSTNTNGCVAACGLVGGTGLSLTVLPFILRGMTLAGIGSALCPRHRRLAAWQRLSNEWKLDNLDEMTTTIGLDGLDEAVPAILAGQVTGRLLVDLGE